MINLKKGSTISLEKYGDKPENIYVGLNWGKINSWWGLWQEDVDLDGSVSMFGADKRHIDTVYFKKKHSDDNSVKHSGDDQGGDDISDDKDNEVISINLKRVSRSVETVFIYLNSYRGQEFDTIPYAKIRLLDGKENGSKNAFASFNLAAEPKYKGKVSMIMAKIVRNGGDWKFVTIGEAVKTRNVKDTVDLIKHHYL
ncbi:MAG TPA: TerD family protein [Cytophagaceae bacterium]|jgi:tellurium resistance protein TerZ|nr:TerD family protein [Cytophagaceae bacterium]